MSKMQYYVTGLKLRRKNLYIICPKCSILLQYIDINNIKNYTLMSKMQYYVTGLKLRRKNLYIICRKCGILLQYIDINNMKNLYTYLSKMWYFVTGLIKSNNMKFLEETLQYAI